MGAPITLDIKATGQAEAKKNVLDVIAQANKASMFGTGNMISAKELKQAEKILTNIKKLQDLIRTDAKQSNVLNKQGNAVLSERQKILTETMRKATTAKNNLEDRINRSKAGMLSTVPNQGGGGGRRAPGGLGGGVAEGLGVSEILGGGASAAIGLMIGKAVISAFTQSSAQLRSATSIAGISRGGVGTRGLLDDLTSYNSTTAGQAQLLGLGNGRQAALNEAYNQAATGATPTSKSITDVLAMSRMGVSSEQSNSLLSTAVSGRSAESTQASRRNPNAGKDLVNFGRIMSQAVTIGMTGVRSGEMIEGINRIAQLTQQTATTANINGISDVVTAAGRLNNPMLQGNRGTETLMNLQSSLLNPGAGIAGQMAAIRAGGFGTSTNSVLQAKFNLEGGLNKANLTRLLPMFRGKGLAGAAALSEFSGGKISMHGAQALLSSFDSGPGGGKEHHYHNFEDLIGDKKFNGTFKGQDSDLVGKFLQQIQNGGQAAEVDITKQQMLDYIMDPLTSAANSLQKLAFGGKYNAPEYDTADAISKIQGHGNAGKTVPGTSIQVVAQPAPMPGK